MKTTFYSLVILFLFSTFAGSLLFAGNTGKIIGRVVDERNEPLMGVNILVVGTTRGAVSDMDGKYAIIGVPIGSHTVRASQIGYQTVEATGVKVGADETTQLNFEMTSSALEQKEVVIRADVLVNPLATGSTKQISEKKIEEIPNVKDVADVMKLQAGVVKQGNNLFLRGGRANEVQYVVDGVPVNSIVGNSGELTGTSKVNEQIAQVAAGVSSGTIGGGSGALSVSANAIQSLSVQTSGFDADYGNAQSGIVNITTKSGGDKILVGAQYRTDKLANTNQNEIYQSYNIGGPEPISRYLLPSLGLKLPGSISFFFSADITRSDGANSYDDNEFFHPLGRKVELDGFLGGIMNGLGFTFYDNLENSFTFNSKIKYDISGDDQVSYGYRASLQTSHGYVHSWRYFADSSSLSSTLSTQHVLSWTHFFSPKAFMKMNIAKLSHRDGNDIAGLKPYEYPVVNSNDYDFDINEDGFVDLGASQRWYQSNTEQWSARFDYNNQIHELHLLKTGLEFNYEVLQSTDISQPTALIKDDTTGELISPPYPEYMDRHRGLYPGYGKIRYVLDNYPHRGALYVQDNIEFSGLNIHLGLRYDYLDLGRQVYYSSFVKRWYSNVNQGETNEGEKLRPEWMDVHGVEYSLDLSDESDELLLSDADRFWYALTHGDFSPRLAIGYPVTDRIVFYFNYGHFYQYPERDQYYRDLPRNVESWLGNPNLKPRKTVQYEAGFEDQMTDDFAFSVHAFYKDYFGYITLVRRLGEIRIYQNLDYASTRGFEISASNNFSQHLTSSISYSYQIAKGRSSSEIGTIINPNSDLPRETRLDWDQQHTANFIFSYRVGHNEEGEFFGLPFINNYGISLTWSYGSGFPYTPQITGRSTDLKNEYLSNNETRPYTSTTNLSIYKGFLLFGRMNAQVTLDITNLFNRRNVQTGDPNGGFNNRDGRPYVFGDYNNNEEKVINPYRNNDARIPPTVFEPPRQILLGVKLNWE
ncbi:MAG: TonB-dependent receptor [Ignavibacteriae bacterium]|nr:TonB-dependent receptor [Ignavibacteriota bacterium]